MKKTNLIVTGIAALLTANTTFAKQSLSNLEGKWELSARVCTDGQSANDRFVMGRDKIILNLKGNILKTSVIIQGEATSESASIAASQYLITTLTEIGKASTFGYTISNKNELVLVSAGFEKGGTCNEGQALLSIFKK